MGVSGAGQTGQLTARKVKNMVADLDEKLSDCGGKDVEGGTPQDSPVGSDNDLSASDTEERDQSNIRSESQNSVSSNHSLHSQPRNSKSPDGAGGRKSLFLKGMTDVQNRMEHLLSHWRNRCHHVMELRYHQNPQHLLQCYQKEENLEEALFLQKEDLTVTIPTT